MYTNSKRFIFIIKKYIIRKSVYNTAINNKKKMKSFK